MLERGDPVITYDRWEGELNLYKIRNLTQKNVSKSRLYGFGQAAHVYNHNFC